MDQEVQTEASTTRAGRTGAGDGAGSEGAGDETRLLTVSFISISLLFSLLPLSNWLLSLFSLLLLPELELSETACMATLDGAVHRGISQTTPVKLLSLKEPFCHLRHGLPDLSRARRPALMAP